MKAHRHTNSVVTNGGKDRRGKLTLAGGYQAQLAEIMKLFKRANYKGCFITTTARPADVTQHARKNKQHLREEATAYREMLTTSSTKRSTRMRKDTDQEAVNRGTKGAD